MNCRHCASPLTLSLLDLGSAPPSNAYLTADALHAPERHYPLRVLVCEECWLVQTEDFADAAGLFSADYAYFSSYSQSWLAHSARYVAEMVGWLGLTAASHVVEVAANDGYLLKYVQAKGIPCLGIEPTRSTAAAARARGLEVVEEFFGASLAERLASAGHAADLLVANNVLAHVPDINDFVRGCAWMLKPAGVATFEFPHLLRLLAANQFDTIYHEHFSYLSLTAVDRIFSANGLTVFNVEELPTHGGSLRVFAQRSARHGKQRRRTDKVRDLLAQEAAAGMTTAGYYSDFQPRADSVKNYLLRFLIQAKQAGATVVGYGAAAKGNTLLNYAGVRPDLLPFVADITPAKQGKFLPGSRIPIVGEEVLRAAQPDYVLLLPWNWKTEMMERLAYVREWDGKFVVAVPRLEVL